MYKLSFRALKLIKQQKLDVKKVFEIGVMKTGTTSLGAAFQILGYNACSWHPKAAAKYAENQEFRVLKKYLDKYDAFDDGPWHDCDYKDLDTAYPNSKFIILERDDESWIRSMERHTSPSYNVNRIRKVKLQKRWLTNREEYIQELLAWKTKKYRDIEIYFQDRPMDLLVFRIEDGWEPLCKFLQKPIPARPFPRKNQSSKNVLSRIYHGTGLHRYI